MDPLTIDRTSLYPGGSSMHNTASKDGFAIDHRRGLECLFEQTGELDRSLDVLAVAAPDGLRRLG
jgi:hypothetical protein